MLTWELSRCRRRDFSKAISDGAASLAKFESDAQSLSTGLFGTAIDQLKAQLAAYSGASIEAFPFQQQLQKQIDAAQAQSDAAKRLSDASALLNDFAQIGAYTGQSLGQLGAQFSAPLDQLAQFLGTDIAGLQKQFDQAEKAALANLEIADNTKLTNEILADIYAQFQGRSEPFSNTDLQGASSGTDFATGTDKPGRAEHHSNWRSFRGVATAVRQGNEQSANGNERLAQLLSEAVGLLRQGVAQGGSNPDDRQPAQLPAP